MVFIDVLNIGIHVFTFGCVKCEKISPYFLHTTAIRRIIYTTNIVEGYRQVAKLLDKIGVSQ